MGNNHNLLELPYFKVTTKYGYQESPSWARVAEFESTIMLFGTALLLNKEIPPLQSSSTESALLLAWEK
jgi:hypothetical protein